MKHLLILPSLVALIATGFATPTPREAFEPTQHWPATNVSHINAHGCGSLY